MKRFLIMACVVAAALVAADAAPAQILIPPGTSRLSTAVAATSAAAKNRGSGGAADGCAAAPELCAGDARSVVRRPDHDVPERRCRGRAWPERSRGIFPQLRQQIVPIQDVNS